MSTAMYHVKPLHGTTHVQDLPTCMYHMKNQSGPDVVNKGTSHFASPVSELVKRQECIIEKLEALQSRISSLTSAASQHHESKADLKDSRDINCFKDVVIACSPTLHPRAILNLLTKLATRHSILLTYYVHSSATSKPCHDLSRNGFEMNLVGSCRTDKWMVITWIWKECNECEMIVSPVRQTKIVGEVNICRYLTRLLGEYPESPVAATVLDQWLDNASIIARGSNTKQNEALSKLAQRLSMSRYIAGNTAGIEDLVNFSAVSNSGLSDKWKNNKHIKQWCTLMS
ncbi:aminoacyl tRNA synthase complex-interacting multifunctional protein 2-like [Watersipora subatra]|uniref:aminoacyl tRNA synthase complex-interacting multifunctional protein 2-like n=1 Tax=Watersipora subatra TaxID=2589382 RepID=UPI00355BC1DF